MMRGFKGTAKLRMSFAGYIGVNNIDTGHGASIKKVNGIWTLVNLDKLYPEIKKLPPEGVKAARAFAKEYNKRLDDH